MAYETRRCNEVFTIQIGSYGDFTSVATDVTDATLGASGLWLGTWTGAGGTATLTESFFSRSPWLRGQQVHS